MAEHIVKYDEKCKSCSGTGLYVGIGERDGAGVVCHYCKGTGCHHVKLTYEDFKGKIVRTDIKRVFEVNAGICIGGDNLEIFGGMPYEDWQKGKLFEQGMEDRKYTCPAQWYQSADYKKKPDWRECSGCGSFSGCKYFSDKASCWLRFDKENIEAPSTQEITK